jgi:alpha-N-acetylglucosaminidase
MEAVHNNPAFFELITDAAWEAPGALPVWLGEFGRQRHADPAGSEAWQRLGASVLDAKSTSIFPERFIGIAVSTPDYTRMLDPEVHEDVRAALHYDPADLVAAIRSLMALPPTDDLALAGIALLLRVLDHRFSSVVHTGQADGFLEVFDDLDELAATRPALRLDTWVAAARRCGADEEERRVLVDNARRLLTVWHTAENPLLDNYAARIWSGLAGGYLKRRWELWLRFLPEALTPDGRAAAQARLDEQLRRLAEAFIADGTPARPGGDVHEVAGRVLARYGDEFLALKGAKDVH